MPESNLTTARPSCRSNSCCMSVREAYWYHALCSSRSHLIPTATFQPQVLSLLFVVVAHFDLPFTVSQLNCQVLILSCVFGCESYRPSRFTSDTVTCDVTWQQLENMLAATTALSRIALQGQSFQNQKRLPNIFGDFDWPAANLYGLVYLSIQRTLNQLLGVGPADEARCVAATPLCMSLPVCARPFYNHLVRVQPHTRAVVQCALAQGVGGKSAATRLSIRGWKKMIKGSTRRLAGGHEMSLPSSASQQKQSSQEG